MARRRGGISAFSKTVVRSIRGSLGRFFAILGIVALGCGFYAGLQMSGPNMRAAADDLYDGTNLYDIRLVSTLGFTSADAERVAQTEGVGAVMPAISCDAMARLGTEQVAVRVSTLDVDAATEGEEQGANTILSSADDYLNRVFLRDGRWPQAADECVIAADKPMADLGIGDDVELLYGAVDLDDVFRGTKLKVVGTVSSSVYPYTGSFGSTTLGSGRISEYLFVAPAAVVEDAPFTEMYVRVEGADAYESGSDEYQAAVDVVLDRLDERAEALAQARLTDVRADAQETLDENRAEYERERRKARRKLADARAELDDAKQKIRDGEKELEDGERELADGRAKAEDGERTYEESRAQLEDAAATLRDSAKQIEESSADLVEGEQQWHRGLDELLAGLGGDAGTTTQSARAYVERSLQELRQGREQLTSGIAQADDGIAQAEAGIAQLESGIAQADDGIAQAEAGLEALESGIAQAQSGLDQLDAALAQTPEGPERDALVAQRAEAAATLEGLEAQRDETQATLDATRAQRDEMQGQLDELRTTLATTQATRRQLQQQLDELPADDELLHAQSAIDELEASRATLDQGRQELEAGVAEYEAGVAEYEDGIAQLADARKELDDAKAELDDGEAELADARTKLADAKAELADGEKEYRKAKAEATEELADARAKLDDAQQEIDDLEPPDIYLLDRSKSEGAVTYDSDTRRMDSIADVFPLMFFLVAALVALTTMTRMVDDERIEIGTYKALGYSTARIAGKYLAYAGAASVSGAVVGIAALSQLLPYIVTSAYSIIYTVPLHPFPLPIHPGIALLSGGLGVGVTLLATWAAVVATLRETPATLMLPRAPAAGKRILLEHVGPVWRRLSFSWKVTCRNLFRYKRRFAMTVIGISGCTALLLVGFGLHDCIWDIIDLQFGHIVHYDTTVALDEDATQANIRDVMRYLESTGEASHIVRVQQENMQAGVAAGDDTLPVQLVVPRSPAELSQAVTLRNRVSGESVSFGDDSVVVTEKIALRYDLSVGSTILLFEQDAIGNAKGEGYALAVTGIAENYVGNIVYAGRGAWAKVEGTKPTFGTIYACVTEDEGVRERIAAKLHDRDYVSTVIYSSESINLYRNMFSVVDMVVVLLIVSAGLLAFIVLYNLTNINIGERVREIASLKVLGFTRMEVYSYIFREIALLAVIGDVLGMAFGTFLETFVATTAEIDYIMFGRTIHPMSYLWSFAITLVFTALILMFMRHKLDKVNMVESLKSIE